MSLKLDADLVDLFEIPFLHLDGALSILGVNAPFIALFGEVSGRMVSELSDDFSDRKFTRRMSAGQPYSFRMLAPGQARSQYTVTLKPMEDQFIGFVTDSSNAAKSEAMLASYSALIEKQNREIKAKTEQINIWRARIQNELDQAATVQDLLVPTRILTPHVDSRCAPVQELSGDFHAIMLAQTLTAFRAHAESPTLTGLVSRIVEMMENRFPDGLFVALTLVRMPADGQTVELLNLGNPDALIMDDSGIVEAVRSVGPAIGFLPAEIYAGLEASKCDFENRRLFVFTDGLTDMASEHGPQGDDIGDIPAFIGDGTSLFDRAVLDRLMDRVGNLDRSDDVTVACFSPTPLFDCG